MRQARGRRSSLRSGLFLLILFFLAGNFVRAEEAGGAAAPWSTLSRSLEVSGQKAEEIRAQNGILSEELEKFGQLLEEVKILMRRR